MSCNEHITFITSPIIFSVQNNGSVATENQGKRHDFLYETTCSGIGILIEGWDFLILLLMFAMPSMTTIEQIPGSKQTKFSPKLEKIVTKQTKFSPKMEELMDVIQTDR